MSKQPFFILTICFILGIFFQDYFSLNMFGIYWTAGVCTSILFSTFFQGYFLHKIKPFLLGILFFGVGIIIHSFNSFSSNGTSFSSNETIVFKISKKLNSTERNKKYEAIVRLENESFNAVIYIPRNHEELDFNHYYKAGAYIIKPESPEYDFQFNYAKYLRRKNIEYQCYLSKGISSAVRPDVSFTEKVSQKRLEVLQSINQSPLSFKTREFLKGIILADRTEIDSQTVSDFSRSGLMHFLAISGTHIVVIFGMIYFLLIRILPLKFRKYAIILSLIFIWLFAAFIGFGNSVLRSCIMLSIYFIYVLLQRKPDLLHSLALSGLIILVADTRQLFDVGFQLSFLAVLGIYWLNQPILNYFPRQDSRLKKIIFNTISISIAAQLATLPLVLYYFHQFSFISVVANFVIVPFSEIIIVFSFLMTGLIAFNINITFVNVIYDFIIEFLLKAIHWFADSDRLFLENIPLNLAEVLALFVIIYLLRFAILKPDVKNLARLIMAVFMFFMIRIASDLNEYQKSEILVHHFRKHKLFSVKKGDRACFWIANNSDKDKIVQYIINPYCASRRLYGIEIKTFPASSEKVVYNGKIYNLK